MTEFSHLDEQEHVKMVDVSIKAATMRRAEASAFVKLSPDTLEKLHSRENPKGDPLEIARIAGIVAAKKTSELIPLCHNINLLQIEVAATVENGGIRLSAITTAHAQTGVEMEALTAVSVAALTVYDMCKAVQPDIEITSIRLESKTGGKLDFRRA